MLGLLTNGLSQLSQKALEVLDCLYFHPGLCYGVGGQCVSNVQVGSCLRRRIVSSSSPGVSWEARVIVTWLSSYLGILFRCRCLFLWRPLLLPLESGWKELLAYFPIVPSRSWDSTSKNDHFSSHIDDFQTPGPQRTWPRAGRPALPLASAFTFLPSNSLACTSR